MSVYQRAYTERDGSVFTQHRDFSIEFRSASHKYWLHKDGEREPATSVTSALKVLDKPALVSWAERCGAEGAARLAAMGELQGVPIEDTVLRVRMHGLGVDAKRDAGADRGTAIHTVNEIYMQSGTVPNVGDFEPGVRGYVSAYCRWLLRDQPEPSVVELLVGSWEHKYAGRLDMRAAIGGRDLVVDLKTSPTARVYPEAHVQTAGYVHALPECSFTEPDGALIVAIGADGTFDTVECCASAQDFLSVLETHRRMRRLNNSLAALEKPRRG